MLFVTIYGHIYSCFSSSVRCKGKLFHTWNETLLQHKSTNNRVIQSSKTGKQIAFHPGYSLYKCKNTFQVQIITHILPLYIIHRNRLKASERPRLLEGFWSERSQRTGRSLKESWSPLPLQLLERVAALKGDSPTPP